MGQPRHLYGLFSFFPRIQFTEKTVGSSRIRTQMVRLEGNKLTTWPPPQPQLQSLALLNHSLFNFSKIFAITKDRKWGSFENEQCDQIRRFLKALFDMVSNKSIFGQLLEKNFNLASGHSDNEFLWSSWLIRPISIQC